MKRAFTLIELLIVVAIIAILAAIAIPNFLEAQTRTKVTRAQSDLRAITVAVEAFHVDNAKYPVCDPVDFDGGVGLSAVTTPVSYITAACVREIFIGKGVGRVFPFYGYAGLSKDGIMDGTNGAAHWYMLFSYGPDLIQNELKTSLTTDDFPMFLGTVYDPTNGVISKGNVYRAGGVIDGNGGQAGRFAATTRSR
ncbi:hypothetical protein BH09SUM1_BH09SUM1_31390 [soil metagenome]